MKHCPIAVIETISGGRHFTGVDAALRDRGYDATWIAGEQPHRLAEHTRVVAVADTRSFERLTILRQARDIGACTVLLMDGIVEHRNTFRNPRAGPYFLRPAPVDVIACAGSIDEQHLKTLGNDAVATGLPRMAGIGPMPLPTRPAVMVATALQPAFGPDDHRRIVEALTKLRERLDAHGVDVLWRLSGGLDLDLGVKPDSGPLAETLAAASAVITTPSTLLIEAMRARRPTALLFPFDDPCWPLAATRLDESQLARPDRIDAVIRELLKPSREFKRRQSDVLARMHREDTRPADAVADLLVELVERPRRKDRPVHRLNPVRLPPRLAAEANRPRVVSLVQCDVSPVGGVTTWSKRMARAFARPDLRYDFRTLLVVTHPDSLPGDHDCDALTEVCVIDPFADHWETIDTLCRAIERLEPSIVVPNYTELCYVASMRLRQRGVRVVAIAHADDRSYRDLLGDYDRWDAAVGVSDACMTWIRAQAGDRPLLRMPCAAPVADAPRRVDPQGPLKLAYVGRIVEQQKRVSDLLLLIDGLEAQGVDFEFHLVGDGPQLAAWRSSIGARRLVHGRIIVHGRCSPEWVEGFMPSIDVSVLVSDYEGTSVSMLEAMGVGVVPAVTRVSSGVNEWIRDGVNGITVPVGEPNQMATRLAAIAGDRGKIADMGRAAWDTVRGRIGIDIMATQYRRLFDAVLARPMDTTPTDAMLRIRDHVFWSKEWVERPDDAMSWIMCSMQEAGYEHVAVGSPTPGCDAVILRAGGVDPVTDRVRRYRAMGLGVGVWPHLSDSPIADALHRVAQNAIDNGCSRIAMYGIGRRAAPLLERGLPIIGFIDDNPPGQLVFGLPIVTVDDALTRLAPDAVLLSSEAWEQHMWLRCAPLRAAGVRILTLYGPYDDATCIGAGVTT